MYEDPKQSLSDAHSRLRSKTEVLCGDGLAHDPTAAKTKASCLGACGELHASEPELSHSPKSAELLSGRLAQPRSQPCDLHMSLPSRCTLPRFSTGNPELHPTPPVRWSGLRSAHQMFCPNHLIPCLCTSHPALSHSSQSRFRC